MTDPRLWDAKPITVTHIAGAQLNMFGRYLRQRCDWCGVVIIEYDLERVAVPVGQPFVPVMWPVGALVRVDGNMSATIENAEVHEDGSTQLPTDACAFDPKTQVGYEPTLPDGPFVERRRFTNESGKTIEAALEHKPFAKTLKLWMKGPDSVAEQEMTPREATVWLLLLRRDIGAFGLIDDGWVE